MGCWIGPIYVGSTPTPPPTPTTQELILLFNSQDFDDRADAACSADLYRDHSQADKALLAPYLVKSLTEKPDNDSRVSIRACAADAIKDFGIYDEQAIEIFISWLDGSEGRDLEMAAIHALEVFAKHAQDATPGLIQSLMAQGTHSRADAAATLAAIGDPVAIPYLLLVVLSSSSETWVRQKVASALAEYGTQAECTVPYLIPLLNNPEDDVRLSAAIIIAQATGNNFPDSERDNWENRTGAWQFRKDTSGEYLILTRIQQWWQDSGQNEIWPECPDGLEGEPVEVLPSGSLSGISP